MKIFNEPQYFAKTKENEDEVGGLTDIDFEEQGAGYQAAYSRLAASELTSIDLLAYISDPTVYFGQELGKAIVANPKIREKIQAADANIVQPILSKLGYTL